MSKDFITMAVSKWLNEYKEKNDLKSEDIAKELDCSFGYIELLLDFKKHPMKYSNTHVPIRFLSKMRDTYKISFEEMALAEIIPCNLAKAIMEPEKAMAPIIRPRLLSR